MKTSTRLMLSSFLTLTLLAPSLSARAQTTPPVRSIRTFGAHCDGKTDDRNTLATAITAASHNAFTLLIDCPLFIHIGMDIRKTIFINNDTNITFTADGLSPMAVDNVLIPAFAIANAHNIKLLNWKINYTGGLPVDMSTGYYYDNGKRVTAGPGDAAAGAWNDIRLKEYLTNWRNIKWGPKANPQWGAPTNETALIYMTGDVSDVVVDNFYEFVGRNAKPSTYAPMVFSSLANYKNNQTVTVDTPMDAAHGAVPHNITFHKIALDGYYMGWQGQFQNTTWDTVGAWRYSDLQDADGNNIGGNSPAYKPPLNKWFAPPHLFYLNYRIDQPDMANRNITLHNILDVGDRRGLPRDQPGEPAVSGNANSIKVGGFNVLVDGYKSFRPDGFLYVLPGDGITLKNMQGTYNSAFLYNMAFGLQLNQTTPGYSYKNVTLQNISLTDTADVTSRNPVGGNTVYPDNANITGTVNVTFNRWANATPPQQPQISGTNVHLNVVYNYKH